MNELPDPVPAAQLDFGALGAELRGRFFRIIAFALLIALAVNGAYYALRGEFVNVAVLGCGALAVCAAIALMRAGHGMQARGLVSIVALAIAAVLMVLGNGIHDVVLAASAGVLLIGILLLERRAFVVFALGTLVTFGAIAGAELAGVLQNRFSSATNLGSLISLETILTLTAVGAWAVVEALSSSLKSAQEQRQYFMTTRAKLDRRAAELDASEQRFTRVFHGSPQPTTISRMSDGTFLEVNEAWLQAFGYTREEVIGRRSLDLPTWADPLDRERMFRMLTEKGSLQNVEFRFRRKSGQIADVLFSAVEIDFGGERALVTPNFDITDRKLTERQLRRSEEWFLKIFHSSPTAIVISRLADGRYVEVNQAWLDIFGYSREELIGRTALELNVWYDPAERPRFVQLIRERGMLRDFETRLRKKSGAIADVTLSVEVVDFDGEPHLIIPVMDITDRKRSEQRIHQLATRDPLTGLPNRLLLADRLALSIANAQRQGQMLAVLFVDIDRFKNVNDSLGHAIGDAFLCEVSARLSAIARSGDTLGRLGGDEFLVLLENVASAEEAGQVAARILEGFSAQFSVEGHSLRCGCSIGISLYPADATEPEGLIRNADTAMYHVKESGRGSYQFFAANMNARVQERLSFEHGLQEALARGEFDLLYQPKVSVASGAITGFEALLRWDRPGEGTITPGRFIAVAEETGLIVEIGRWVLERACSQIDSWRERGFPIHPIAINLSVRQFTPTLVSDIRDALERARVGPELIELEITESVFMRHPAEARAILRELAEIGTRVTIDDFGTGYSSLSYIKHFMVDALKIDRSFVTDLTSTPQDVAIIRAVIEMGRALGIKVIAEGVETKEQLGLLRGLDCSEYQGFYFSEPLPPEEIERRYLAH